MMEPPDREVEILNAAVELHPAQRAAYLDQACGGDAALRQQVEELLRAHDQAENFLKGPPAGADFQSTVRVNIPLTEKTGDTIGRYKLLQQIGEGGCGVVYMAAQEEPVRRRVALKVIKLGMDTRNVIARFEAERQALALMDHPNIAKVLDAGATDAGRPFFVMELVKGVRITDYCDQHNLAAKERLKLFMQVCRAIQHAHQKGIIHRDIKPSNILVTLHDGVPVPKVIDFGIAKATTDQPLTDKTLFTAFEQFIGTPAYMSPEQAEMTSLDIDTRTDIYALGVLLYELLTGRTPFDPRALLASGLEAMRRTIREEEPARPSTALSTMLESDLTHVASHRQSDAMRLISLVRGDLDWIVMKALEKDRTRRYETANAFAMDVGRYLASEPVIARPPNQFYRMQKLVRRNKLAFTAVAAVTASLAIGVVLAAWQAVRATHEQRIATHERDHAVRAEAEAQQQKLVAQSEARSAAVQLAESLIDQGDALTTAREYLPAFARYAEAAEHLQKLGTPLARLDLSLVRLYRASPPPLWTTNFPDYVNGIVALPSRRELIAACNDGKFYALDLLSGAIVRAFGDSRPARTLALANSTNGPVLVAGGLGSVQMIDPQSGTVLRQVEDNRAEAFCVVSPDGSMAASGNNSGLLAIWDTATFKKLGGKDGSRVTYAAFSHDGATIATVGDDIALWNARTGQPLRRLPARPGTRVAFSADDQALVCGENGGFISTLSLEGKPLARWLASRSNNGIRSLLATPEGNRIIAAIDDGEVRIFDNSFGDAWTSTLAMAADQSVMFGALYIPDAGPKACAATAGLSPADQGVMVAASVRGRVFAWPLVAPDRFQDRLERAISVSPDGLLCAGELPGRVEVRDLATGRTLRLLPQPVACKATAFSRDATRLYIGADDGTLRAFDLARGEYTWSVHAHNGYIGSLDVSPDDGLVGSASADGTTRVWDARTGALRGSLHHQGGYGTAAVFVPGTGLGKSAKAAGGPAPGSQRMVIGTGDNGLIYDWDVFSDAQPRFVYAPGYVRGITLSPDQKLLAVACVAHGAALIKAATLGRMGFLGPVPSAMYKVCFIDSGAGPGAWALACGGRELRAFEMATGRERLVLDSTFDERAAASTDTGTYGPNTLAASGDGTVVVAKGTGRINFTLPQRYRELTQAPSPLRRAGLYAEWGLWAWVRELLERERAAGRECPALLLAQANWMCGDYDSARRAFDLAVSRHEAPRWYGELCASLGDTPPTTAPLPAVPRPRDASEQLTAAQPLPEGVLAAAEVPVLLSRIGKDVVVEGVVTASTWSRSGKIMNIRFAGVEEGKIGLFACIFLKDRAAFDRAFGDDAASAFSGARLRLRGKLVLYGGFDDTLKGAPQMILQDTQQVTIVQQRPAAGALGVPLSAVGIRLRDAETALGQAVLLREQGKLAEAEGPCRNAIALFKQVVQDDPAHSDLRIKLGHLQWQLGDALVARGQREEAERVFSEALEVFAHAVTNFPGVAYLRQEQGFSAWKLAAALESGDQLEAAEAQYRHAIALHEKASADFPDQAVFTERLSALNVRLIQILRRRGKSAEAELLFGEAAGHADAQALNGLAWPLATDPDPKLRDGPRAVALAEKAVASTDRKNPMIMDTLAAAYAEAGQFTNAVRVQQEAIALLKSDKEKQDYASRLKLYENNSPYRDVPVSKTVK